MLNYISVFLRIFPMLRLVTCIFIACICCGAVAAQDTLVIRKDTLAGLPDTTELPTPKAPRQGFFTAGYPSPQKALLCSAILPGAGQVYNRQYLKLPIVYGVFTASYLYFRSQTKDYNRLKTEYIARVDTDPTTIPEPALINVTTAQIGRLRDVYRSKRETAGLLFVTTYLLTAAEAYVGAHLKSFDVSDDLSLHIGPSTQSGAIGFGIKCMVRP